MDLAELAAFLLDNECPSDADGPVRVFTFELCEMAVIVTASKETGEWVVREVQTA